LEGRRGLRADEAWVQAAGHRLRVRRIPGAGPTLVFLHEGLGGIAQWRDVPAALAHATGLPALVYERYGYGASDPRVGPPDPHYLEEESLRALPEVLAACGIERPFLVGHSDGGSIALLYGAQWPDRPLGIVTEAAHVFMEAMGIEGLRRAREAFETTDFRDRLKRHHGDRVDAMFHNWNDVWLDPRHLDWTFAPRLSAITAPVLAVQGLDDEYGTPAQVETIVRGVKGPSRSLLVPGCGHVPHFQARDLVLGEMARFIRETLALPSTAAP